VCVHLCVYACVFVCMHVCTCQCVRSFTQGLSVLLVFPKVHLGPVCQLLCGFSDPIAQLSSSLLSLFSPALTAVLL
jgi:hypothetical protein